MKCYGSMFGWNSLEYPFFLWPVHPLRAPRQSASLGKSWLTRALSKTRLSPWHRKSKNQNAPKTNKGCLTSINCTSIRCCMLIRLVCTSTECLPPLTPLANVFLYNYQGECMSQCIPRRLCRNTLQRPYSRGIECAGDPVRDWVFLSNPILHPRQPVVSCAPA